MPVFGGSDGVVERSFSRRDIVLPLANQDAGAHVDPELDASYAEMARLNALGTIEYTTTDGETHTSDCNPALAVMRQIAWEIVDTLAPVIGGS